MTDNRETKPPPIPTAKEAIADIGADTAARLKRAEIAKKQAEAEQPQESSDTTPPPSKEQVIAEIDADIALRRERAEEAREQTDAPNQKTT